MSAELSDGGQEQERTGRGRWTEPAVEFVAPGVHRVPLPLPGDALRAVNVYVLVDGGRATLIDSGWSFGPGMEMLENAFATLDLDLSQLDRVLATHMHRDHYTLAMRLRERFGTTVVLGAGERETIENILARERDGKGNRESGRRSWLTHLGAEELRPQLESMPALSPSDYEAPDSWLEGPADVLAAGRTLRAIPTPGHTRGHLVFADLEHGLLFSGDHVLPQITPSIGVEPVPALLPLADFLSSLALIKQLPDLDLLPAHGPLGRRSHERTDELIEFHRVRLETTAKVVTGEAVSAFAVAQQLSWTRRERAFADLDIGNQLLAAGETAAHLDVLVRDGVLTSSDDNGTRMYIRVD